MQIRISTFVFFFILTNYLSAQDRTPLDSSWFDETIGDSVYTRIDTSPEFPPEKGSLHKFLAKNIQYPPLARENNVQGTVVAEFIVTKQGRIVNIVIKKSLSKECDEEVIRIIKLMPAWIPARRYGSPISFRMILPVSFRLM